MHINHTLTIYLNHVLIIGINYQITHQWLAIWLIIGKFYQETIDFPIKYGDVYSKPPRSLPIPAAGARNA